MKKKLLNLILGIFATTLTITVHAQQVSSFEDITLASNSYLNGSGTPNGTVFISGNAIFPNYFKTYWSKGWAISNMKDSTTAGYTNMYSAVTAMGYNSATYAVGQQGSIIRVYKDAMNGNGNGVYVTNGTYAAISMKNGDGFARKFGDTTGTKSGLPQGSYPDWFKLTIKGFSNGTLKTDSVNFYLADYRFTDNTKDYIVKEWKWVDLTALGNVDSVVFNLSSSDIGNFGMNTPSFFCIDNFTTANMTTTIAEAERMAIQLYPNPAKDNITIDLSKSYTDSRACTIDVFDVTGRKVDTFMSTGSLINLSIQAYKTGMYLISVRNDNTFINLKFIKN